MSKFVAVKPIEYRDLIKEVYIDPIRTVVVIDDEFPSLDGLIAKELGSPYKSMQVVIFIDF